MWIVIDHATDRTYYGFESYEAACEFCDAVCEDGTVSQAEKVLAHNGKHVMFEV